MGGSNSGMVREIYLPSIVFGLPTKYQNSDGAIKYLSYEAAATKAAKVTETAKLLTYMEFRDSPYLPDDAAVIQYFKSVLAAGMATERGTAGANGSGSSSIVFRDEVRSFFNPYSCE